MLSYIQYKKTGKSSLTFVKDEINKNNQKYEDNKFNIDLRQLVEKNIKITRAKLDNQNLEKLVQKRIKVTRSKLNLNNATQKYLDANTEYTTAKVWGGRDDIVSLGVAEDISITLPRISFKDSKLKSFLLPPFPIQKTFFILSLLLCLDIFRPKLNIASSFGHSSSKYFTTI